MRRVGFDFAVDVSVDGIRRDQRMIWVHPQDEPFPGGHRYEVRLHGAPALEYLRGQPCPVRTRLDKGDANSFLNLIYWALEAPEPEVAFEFVLNTIDAVEVSGETICITGECSPFIRANRQKL
jgi:hypothetical protein